MPDPFKKICKDKQCFVNVLGCFPIILEDSKYFEIQQTVVFWTGFRLSSNISFPLPEPHTDMQTASH